MRENLLMYIGFIFIGVVLYLDFGKQYWGDYMTTEDGSRLLWYGIGCAILIIGLIWKKMNSVRM